MCLQYFHRQEFQLSLTCFTTQKNLSNWLKTNKIFVNAGKTELVLFTSSKQQLDCGLKIKLNGKRLYETDSVKYLGIQIDKRLTWK